MRDLVRHVLDPRERELAAQNHRQAGDGVVDEAVDRRGGRRRVLQQVQPELVRQQRHGGHPAAAVAGRVESRAVDADAELARLDRHDPAAHA